jgi:hypothetical protein
MNDRTCRLVLQLTFLWGNGGGIITAALIMVRMVWCSMELYCKLASAGHLPSWALLTLLCRGSSVADMQLTNTCIDGAAATKICNVLVLSS